MPVAPQARSAHAERVTLLERLLRTGPVRRVFATGVVRRVLSPARGDRAVHKFIRYSMVSGVAIVISQVTILICAAFLHLSGILANTIGALAATPASYELNRKWAWGKRGKSHMWKEVAPFWALTLIGYLASTGTVQIADSLCASHDVTGLDRAFAIMGASLFAYGVVWIAKFVVFNKLVFAEGPGATVPTAPANGSAAESPQPGNGQVPSSGPVPNRQPNGQVPKHQVPINGQHSHPAPGQLSEQAKPSVAALEAPTGTAS